MVSKRHILQVAQITCNTRSLVTLESQERSKKIKILPPKERFKAISDFYC